MEQFVRDARIAQIYEGANGIQALDLVRRKLFIHGGRLPARLFRLIADFADQQQENDALWPYIGQLTEALDLLRDLTEWLVQQGTSNPDQLGAAATDYLRLFALTTFAWMWVQMIAVAQAKQDGSDADFYRAKIQTGRFFLGRLLPQIHALDRAVRSGSDLMMDMQEANF